MNRLRQDVFHWHLGGAERDEFVRRRPKTDERITIDAKELEAARERFDQARLVGEAARRCSPDELGLILSPRFGRVCAREADSSA